MTEIKAMREQFIRAYSGTSFSPEKRAESCINDFSDELSADLTGLENVGQYKEKYLAFLSRWAGARSRCMSAMITGPANFPVARNIKAYNAEKKAWDDFRKWRERYIKRVNAVKTKTPEEEIDDALAKLDTAKMEHERMIEANKCIRKKDRDGLLELGFTDAQASELIGDDGFQSFELSNSRARIKSLEDKLVAMRRRIETRDSFEPIRFDGGEITIEDDRVKIWHESKPEPEIIAKLKSNGFRWSPHWGCWCRKHTANALRAAKSIVL